MKSAVSVKKIALLAMFSVISLALYAVESLIPPFIAIPGIKLGLANIVSLIVLCIFGFKSAACTLLVRILLSSLLFGQAMSFFFSLFGGLFSIIVMALLHRWLTGKAIILTATFGALAHNIAQIAVAFFIVKTRGVLSYLPYLMISGIITGLFIGICTFYLLTYLKPLKALKQSLKE